MAFINKVPPEKEKIFSFANDLLQNSDSKSHTNTTSFDFDDFYLKNRNEFLISSCDFYKVCHLSKKEFKEYLENFEGDIIKKYHDKLNENGSFSEQKFLENIFKKNNQNFFQKYVPIFFERYSFYIMVMTFFFTVAAISFSRSEMSFYQAFRAWISFIFKI